MEIGDLPAISAPLPWQSQAWQQLQAQIAGGQLPHALLLSGSEYTGKARLAMALARYLLCTEPADGHNCGTCHACEMSRAGSHADFRWLQPEEKSRTIKIDQIRDVVNFGTLTASFGSRKVLVFAPAESMNANAANALLKSLEEPTAGTYMLLVCHRPQRLPATVRSRCQQLRFALPNAQQSLEWLDHLSGKRADSEKLLELAAGRPLLAEKIYRDADMEAVAAIPVALEMLREGRKSTVELNKLLAALPIEDALGQLASFLQGTIRSAGQTGELDRGSRRIFTLLDEVNRLQRAVHSGANPNTQLLLHALLGAFHKELTPSEGPRPGTR